MAKLKGISQSAIYATAKKNNISVVELYEDIHNGKGYNFDLCDGQTCLELKKDGKIYKKDSFVKIY
jgi:hypothetical protein